MLVILRVKGFISWYTLIWIMTFRLHTAGLIQTMTSTVHALLNEHFLCVIKPT